MWLALLIPTAFASDAPAPDPLAVAHALEDAFTNVAARVAPTVVYIQAEKGTEVATGLHQLMTDYALPSPGASARGSSSSGSGVVVRADGLVLTNHHVVSGATSIFVTLQDKRTYPADLIGSDARTDVAVLRIRGPGPFEAAAIGDSERARIGQWVLAVGHPFDFTFSVTAGIVSARGRRNLARDEIQDYIQTDASVNPGSSGGPLFNLDGEVIGINTAIYSPARNAVQSAGISFAIPSSMAWRIAQELMQNGRVARPGIGVTTRDSPATADDPRPGAEITRVVPNGPAEKAGLLRGDVIVAVEGEPIASSEDLRGIVLSRGVDADLGVTFERGGATRAVVVRAWSDERLGEADIAIPAAAFDWAGLTLAPADDQTLAHFGVAIPPQRYDGLIVLAVRPGSAGATAGLAPGDVVLEVQRREIKDADQFHKLVEGLSSAFLLFWRGDGVNYAVVAGLR